MERLVDEDEIVSKDWEKQPYGGYATDSVVVMLVKKGNPLGLKSFKDLETNEEAEVVTPNPFSSGSARWNIMAIYGSARLAAGFVAVHVPVPENEITTLLTAALVANEAKALGM
jgi:sulfate transport system substrate-binding protein